MSTAGPFWLLVCRDVRIAWREGAAIGTALGFYVTVVVLVPLGIGPDLALLGRIGPGILWIGLLLAAQVTLGQMFETDREEGVLEVLATGPLPLELVAGAKALAHWLTTGLPLAILAPLLGLLVNLDLSAYPVLIATTLLGTPAISFIGSMGAALTLKARRSGLLTAALHTDSDLRDLGRGRCRLAAGQRRRFPAAAARHEPCFARARAGGRGSGSQGSSLLTWSGRHPGADSPRTAL